MHTVPQTQTNSVSLYLHYFFRLKIGKIQKYVFLIMNIQIKFARFILHHSIKNLIIFTLFNLALLFKLYFSFRESYDLILR